MVPVLPPWKELIEAAFVAAAKADAPKPSALQKSRTIIGLRGNEPGSKKEKANENSLRTAEVRSPHHIAYPSVTSLNKSPRG